MKEEDIRDMILRLAPIEMGWWLDQVIHDEIRGIVDIEVRQRLFDLLREHSRIEYQWW